MVPEPIVSKGKKVNTKNKQHPRKQSMPCPGVLLARRREHVTFEKLSSIFITQKKHSNSVLFWIGLFYKEYLQSFNNKRKKKKTSS